MVTLLIWYKKNKITVQNDAKVSESETMINMINQSLTLWNNNEYFCLVSIHF